MTVLLSLAFCFAFTANANADAIAFTHEGTGSGTLDGTVFETTDFVISATGDTDDREDSQFGDDTIFELVHLTASIELSGIGTYAFLERTFTFAYNDTSQNSGTVGFSLPDRQIDLFDGPFDEAAFATWDMTTFIGPISGSGMILNWGSGVQTSGGLLILDRDSDTTATFTASVVPEPSLVVLLGVCLIGGWMRQRRR